MHVGAKGKSPERPPVFYASNPPPLFSSSDAELFVPTAKSEGEAAQYSWPAKNTPVRNVTEQIFSFTFKSL